MDNQSLEDRCKELVETLAIEDDAQRHRVLADLCARWNMKPAVNRANFIQYWETIHLLAQAALGQEQA